MLVPQFLTIEEVLDLHCDSLELFGGLEGVRDLDLLSSALAQPPMTFDGVFLHDDLHAMAAAYLFHLVSNHPFIDGNKRTGLAAAGAFLALNGFDIPVEQTEQLYEITIATAEGRLTKPEIASRLRQLSLPTE